ncbi:MAG: hypothetical protein WCF90_01650 [Methanomicrobiales archaeon]
MENSLDVFWGPAFISPSPVLTADVSSPATAFISAFFVPVNGVVHPANACDAARKRRRITSEGDALIGVYGRQILMKIVKVSNLRHRDSLRRDGCTGFALAEST